MNAFKEDCQELIDKFVATNSLKFKAFAAVWGDMKFPFVFYGQRPLGFIRQFTEEALIIAKYYWLKSGNSCESIAGLYLMYALYFKHRLPGLIQITLTLDEMVLVSNFAKSIEDPSESDPAFILQKLFYNDAFHFSACITSHGMEKHFRLQTCLENRLPPLETLENDFSDLIKFMAVYNEYVEAKREIVDHVGDISVSKTLLSQISQDLMHLPGSSSSNIAKNVILPTISSPEKKKRKILTVKDSSINSSDFSTIDFLRVPHGSNDIESNIITNKEASVNLPSTSGICATSDNRSAKQRYTEVKSGCVQHSLRLNDELSDLLKTLYSEPTSQTYEESSSPKTKQVSEFSWIFREDDGFECE